MPLAAGISHAGALTSVAAVAVSGCIRKFVEATAAAERASMAT